MSAVIIMLSDDISVVDAVCNVVVFILVRPFAKRNAEICNLQCFVL